MSTGTSLKTSFTVESWRARFLASLSRPARWTGTRRTIQIRTDSTVQAFTSKIEIKNEHIIPLHAYSEAKTFTTKQKSLGIFYQILMIIFVVPYTKCYSPQSLIPNSFVKFLFHNAATRIQRT